MEIFCKIYTCSVLTLVHFDYTYCYAFISNYRIVNEFTDHDNGLIPVHKKVSRLGTLGN